LNDLVQMCIKIE